MSIEYRIIFLHFKRGLSVAEIAMVLEHEIVAKQLNTTKIGKIHVDHAPVEYVRRVIYQEKVEIENQAVATENANRKELDLKFA